MISTADTLRQCLRADLLASMRERNPSLAGVIRSLLAAIDNAQAVPIGHDRPQTEQARFGDEGIEVARYDLSAGDLKALLLGEARRRHDAAAQFSALGQMEEADRASEEARIVARYLD